MITEADLDQLTEICEQYERDRGRCDEIPILSAAREWLPRLVEFTRAALDQALCSVNSGGGPDNPCWCSGWATESGDHFDYCRRMREEKEK